MLPCDYYWNQKTNGEASRTSRSRRSQGSFRQHDEHRPRRIRLPRSADPSPQRTTHRLESLNELHGGPLATNPPWEQFKMMQSSRLMCQDVQSHSRGFPTAFRDSQQVYHQQRVMRAYHSPQSDFTYPRRQSQTLVWVDNRLVNTSSPVFHSEVVSKTDSSIRKLDEKKQTLEQIVHILSGKLENKMRRRRHRSCRSESDALEFERESDIVLLERPKKCETPIPKTEKTPDFRSRLQVNLSDLKCKDLSDRSYQELVFTLIHVKRQVAGINESIESLRSELENLTNVSHLKSDSKREDERSVAKDRMTMIKDNLKNLEIRHARGVSMVNFTDKMVKFSSLYKGPKDAPLSHRVRNLQFERTCRPQFQPLEEELQFKEIREQRREDIQNKMEELYQIELGVLEETVIVKYLLREHQDLLEDSLQMVRCALNDTRGALKMEPVDLIKQQKGLMRDLDKVRQQLQQSRARLDDVALMHVAWENEILVLRQKLQASAIQGMAFGLDESAEILTIESELAAIRQQANDLHNRRKVLIMEIDVLSDKQEEVKNQESRKETSDSSIHMQSKDSNGHVESADEFQSFPSESSYSEERSFPVLQDIFLTKFDDSHDDDIRQEEEKFRLLMGDSYIDD